MADEYPMNSLRLMPNSTTGRALPRRQTVGQGMNCVEQMSWSYNAQLGFG